MGDVDDDAASPPAPLPVRTEASAAGVPVPRPRSLSRTPMTPAQQRARITALQRRWGTVTAAYGTSRQDMGLPCHLFVPFSFFGDLWQLVLLLLLP